MPTVPILRPFSAFAAARGDYLLTLEQERMAAKSVEKYALAIRRLQAFAGEVDPAAIDARLLRRFDKHLADGDLGTTIQHDL